MIIPFIYWQLTLNRFVIAFISNSKRFPLVRDKSSPIELTTAALVTSKSTSAGNCEYYVNYISAIIVNHNYVRYRSETTMFKLFKLSPRLNRMANVPLYRYLAAYDKVKHDFRPKFTNTWSEWLIILGRSITRFGAAQWITEIPIMVPLNCMMGITSLSPYLVGT